MIGILALAGGAYAGGLWFIAQRVAERRALALGERPRWLVPLAALAALVVAAVLPAGTAMVVASTVIGASVCAVVDARTGLILDALSFTMIIVAAAETIAMRCFDAGLVAFALVGGLLFALYVGTGRRGIGLGDVKLGSAIALGYGPSAGALAVGGAFVLGATYAIAMLAMGRATRSDALRFGPFMAGGTIVGAAAAAGWIR
jgi:leader peptidase (prepilin peptidase)/N-methyltransferase